MADSYFWQDTLYHPKLAFCWSYLMCKDFKDEKWVADMYVGCISRVEHFLLVGQGCQKLVGVRCTVSNVVGENQVLFLFGVVAISFLCLSRMVS